MDEIGPGIAVLSRDLHQLVDPDAPTRWYPWTVGDARSLARAKDDLIREGLPWLEEHLSLENLIVALEHERDRPRAPQGRESLRVRDATEDLTPPVRLNVLRFLSYAYELHGRIQAALEAWERYIRGHTLLEKGSSLERQLNERLVRLKMAAKAHE
jgi:hypothetical protein